MRCALLLAVRRPIFHPSAHWDRLSPSVLVPRPSLMSLLRLQASFLRIYEQAAETTSCVHFTWCLYRKLAIRSFRLRSSGGMAVSTSNTEGGVAL